MIKTMIFTFFAMMVAANSANSRSAFFEMTGDCVVVNDCVSSGNYPANHGNNEYCAITMLQDVYVTASAELQVVYDYDVTGRLRHGFDVESSNAVPSALYAGEMFSWSSDFSVTKAGWQLCFSTESPSETPDQSTDVISSTSSIATSMDPTASPTRAPIVRLPTAAPFTGTGTSMTPTRAPGVATSVPVVVTSSDPTNVPTTAPHIERLVSSTWPTYSSVTSTATPSDLTPFPSVPTVLPTQAPIISAIRFSLADESTDTTDGNDKTTEETATTSEAANAPDKRGTAADPIIETNSKEANHIFTAWFITALLCVCMILILWQACLVYHNEKNAWENAQDVAARDMRLQECNCYYHQAVRYYNTGNRKDEPSNRV